MTDPSGYTDYEERTGIPRWVKVSALIVIVVGIAVVLLMVIGGGGEHGPGRHTSPDDGGNPSISESGGPGGHTRPEGSHG